MIFIKTENFKNLFLKIQKRFSMLTRPEKITIFLLFSGLILRAKHYFTNCALWTDEAWFSIGIVNRSWKEIFIGHELFPHCARAPLIFNFLEKLSITIFGNHEWSLRFFPFLFAIISLFIFYILLSRLKKPRLACIVMFFFALSPILIYYSAEVKQYSLDLFITLSLLLASEFLPKKRYSFKFVLTFGLLGSICIWISNASLFILASIGIVFFFENLRRKRWNNVFRLSISFLFWISSFAILYYTSLKYMIYNEGLYVTWPDGFAPTPITVQGALLWLQDIFLKMFTDPLALSFPLLALFLFLTGARSLYKENKKRFFILILPIILLLIAGLARTYPFKGRVILLVIPSVLIFLSTGILFFSQKLKNHGNIFLIFILCLLFTNSLREACSAFLTDYCKEDNRKICQIIQKEFQPGDFIFFSPHGQFAFWYYEGRSGLLKKQLKSNSSKKNSLKTMQTGLLFGSVVEDKGEEIIPFRYGLYLYDDKGEYQSSFFEKKIYFLLKNYPFPYNIDKSRVWIFASGCDPDLFEITVKAFEMRWPKLLERKYKRANIALFSLKNEKLKKIRR